MQKTIELAVILLNWNAADDTCSCLERMNKWKSIRPLIYVVDNGSIDDSVQEISTEFPDVELILNRKNAGFSGGNNAALRKILGSQSNDDGHNSCQCILLLNNDAFIEEKDLVALLESLMADQEVGITGPLLFEDNAFGKLLSAGGLDPSENGRTYWAGPVAEEHIARAEEPYSVDYVSGTVALLRNSVLREVGFFDEDYFFSCEMADLCERVKTKGYLCTINPMVRAWHNMQSSGKQRDTLYLYYSLRNRFLFIRKFRRENITRLFFYWGFIGAKGMVKNLFIGKITTVRAIALALRDGVTGRYGGKNELFL